MVIKCKCGHAFPESLGKYGCPNCEGETMTEPQTAAERKAAERKRRDAAGYIRKDVWIKKGKDAELKAAVDKINCQDEK